MAEPPADRYGEEGRHVGAHAVAPEAPARPRDAVSEEVAHRPRGAMLATLLYLAVVVAAWLYMYVGLLRAGQGPAP